jgi:hypothetical protein
MIPECPMLLGGLSACVVEPHSAEPNTKDVLNQCACAQGSCVRQVLNRPKGRLAISTIIDKILNRNTLKRRLELPRGKENA